MAEILPVPAERPRIVRKTAEILPAPAAAGVIPVFAEKRLSRKRSDPPPQRTRTRTPAVFRAGKNPARASRKHPSGQGNRGKSARTDKIHAYRQKNG